MPSFKSTHFETPPQMPATAQNYLIKRIWNYYSFIHFRQHTCKPLALQSIRNYSCVLMRRTVLLFLSRVRAHFQFEKALFRNTLLSWSLPSNFACKGQFNYTYICMRCCVAISLISNQFTSPVYFTFNIWICSYK